MLDVVKHLDDIGGDIVKLRGLLLEALKGEEDPTIREAMSGLHDALSTTFDEYKVVLPAAQEQANKEIAALNEAAKTIQSDIEEIQSQIDKAAALAAAPPPPPPAPPAYDPRLGKTLRDELVGRFGPKRPAGAAAPVAHGDVADVASSEFKSMEQPAAPQAPPKPAAAPPQAAPAPPSPSKAPKTPPPSPSKAPKTPKPKQPGDDGGEWTRDA